MPGIQAVNVKSFLVLGYDATNAQVVALEFIDASGGGITPGSAIAAAAFMYAQDNSLGPGGQEIRVQSLQGNGDNQNPDKNGLVGVVSKGYIYNAGTDGWDRPRSLGNNADALATLSLGLTSTANFPFGFNGATYDRVRVANVFKTVDVSASGNTTIWTPTSGKKFRLMGGSISASGTAAALVAALLKLQDGAGGTNIVQFHIAIAATVTGDTQISFTCNNGYLSAAANTVLNANLSNAFTAGGCVVNVYGTEE